MVGTQELRIYATTIRRRLLRRHWVARGCGLPPQCNRVEPGVAQKRHEQSASLVRLSPTRRSDIDAGHRLLPNCGHAYRMPGRYLDVGDESRLLKFCLADLQ